MSDAGSHPHGEIEDLHSVLAPDLSNGTTSDAREVAAVRSMSQKRDRARQSNSIVPLVLLNRSARETQQNSSSVNLTQHAQVLKRGRDQRGQSKRSNRSRLQTQRDKKLASVIPIEEALSRTAPDWVGQALPPVELSDIRAECDDGLCTSRLSEREQRQFNWCTGRANYRKRGIGPISSDNFCHFQNGTNRHPVALASFPGSGNTWVRGLIQKITGICTGKVIHCVH